MDCKSRTPFVAHWSIAEAHSPLHQYTVAATLFLMIFSQNPSCQRLPAQICSTICLCISTLWQFFCRKILGKSFKKKDCVSLEPTIQKARKVTHSDVVICFCIVLNVIPSVLLSFLPDFCHSFQIFVIPSKYCHSFRIIQKMTNTNYLQKLPIPEGREKWPPEVPIYASKYKV